VFENIVGNEKVNEHLRRVLKARRVPHSLLFTGPEGVGKRLFAVELAKGVLCSSAADGVGCGVCSTCIRADAFEFPKPDDKDGHEKVIFSRHADVGTIIPYNKNLLVKAVRDLESEANFRPYEGAARFFIVDDADKMNEAASNALLKTLEEPPATSYIFLISSRPDALLPTIRSRCQTLRFRPVSTAEVSEFLSSSNKVLPEDIPLAARLAEGSIGRAMRLDISRYRDSRKAMLEVLEAAIVNSDAAELLCLGETMNDAKHKDDFEANLNILKTLLHDVWLISLGKGDSIVNIDERPRLETVTENTTQRNIARVIAAIEEVQENFAVNINRKLATDSLFARMAA
jgi:DNA polymerase-3 subunit delta'